MRRSSTGSIPRVSAITSMWRSPANCDWGAPNPRNAPNGTAFVNIARPVMRTCSQAYGPAAWMIARDRTTGDSVTYAPPSITTSMSWARSRPSRASPVVPHQRGVPLGGRGHVLAAVVDQLHRPTALQRQQGRMQGDMGREFFLTAEPATGGRLDHPHFGLVARERLLQRLEDVVGTLHRALHHQHVALEIGDHP